MIFKIKKLIKSNAILFLLLKQGLIYIRFLRSIGGKSLYAKLPRLQIRDSIIIGKKGIHCYFGYYDKSPLDYKNERVLYIKVPNGAKPGTAVDVCIYNMKTKTDHLLGRTHAWNWQQGCMEQWINDEIISYNIFNNKKKEYETIRLNINTKAEVRNKRAVYAYNKDFSKYLSLNFYRLDLFAKGYGYSFKTDSDNYNEDGIWEVNTASDESELVLTLAEVIAFEPKDYMQYQHYINHVAYCPDERYIIFIHRWQVKGGEFNSRLLKYDLVEKKLMSLLANGHVSHYCWKSPSELMIYATNEKNEKGYLVLDIQTCKSCLLKGLPTEDGHPTFSKDGKWIVTDTYPDNHRNQYLFLYETKEKKLYVVDKLYSPFKYFNEYRCDLHPRWSKDGKYIVVDNTVSGIRSLKIYKVNI